MFVPLGEKNYDTIKEWWQNLPLLTTILIFLTFGSLIAEQIYPECFFLMMNQPAKTIYDLELWRIFSASFGIISGMYGWIGLIIDVWWFMSVFPYYVPILTYLGTQILHCTLLRRTGGANHPPTGSLLSNRMDNGEGVVLYLNLHWFLLHCWVGTAYPLVGVQVLHWESGWAG